jgi:hypothetical protein
MELYSIVSDEPQATNENQRQRLNFYTKISTKGGLLMELYSITERRKIDFFLQKMALSIVRTCSIDLEPSMWVRDDIDNIIDTLQFSRIVQSLQSLDDMSPEQQELYVNTRAKLDNFKERFRRWLELEELSPCTVIYEDSSKYERCSATSHHFIVEIFEQNDGPMHTFTTYSVHRLLVL